MTTEEEEVALVMQGDDLATAELRERGEEGSEHATDSVTQQRCEAVQDEFGWGGRQLVTRERRSSAYESGPLVGHVPWRCQHIAS